MSVYNLSQFFYGITIDETNFSFSVNEGSGEINATLNAGSYSFEEAAVELERALLAAGNLLYSVSTNRLTRNLVVSANANFSILVATTSLAGANAFALLGFTGADRTGSNSYTGNAGCGSVYRPQFLLQNYVDFEDNVTTAFTTVNKSASGTVEVVNFGSEQKMECNITFVTDFNQGGSDVIENNPNAVAELRDFLRYCITKGTLEFMPNRDNPNFFIKCLFESGFGNTNGTMYKMREMYSKGLAGYFETGTIIFRRLL